MAFQKIYFFGNTLCSSVSATALLRQLPHRLGTRQILNIRELTKITSTGSFSTSANQPFKALCFTTLEAKIMSKGDTKDLCVKYEEILEVQKDQNILIIDVREHAEIDETGKLPGSIHIPMADVAKSLINLPEKDFESKYNRKKPEKDTKIILSCRSGKRSAMVQEEIQKMGYKNVYNYVGGWLDWEKNRKP